MLQRSSLFLLDTLIDTSVLRIVQSIATIIVNYVTVVFSFVMRLFFVPDTGRLSYSRIDHSHNVYRFTSPSLHVLPVLFERVKETIKADLRHNKRDHNYPYK